MFINNVNLGLLPILCAQFVLTLYVHHLLLSKYSAVFIMY